MNIFKFQQLQMFGRMLISKYGTSEGATRGWDTRGRGRAEVHQNAVEGGTPIPASVPAHEQVKAPETQQAEAKPAKAKNPYGKTVKVNAPHAVFRQGGWEWRVLKTYQTPEAEKKNPYARWFCAVKSPATFGSYDMGDTYVHDIPKDDVVKPFGGPAREPLANW